jgi:hypothetical protein
MPKDYDLSVIEGQDSVGVDTYLSGSIPDKKASMGNGRRKIASLGDLDGFLRTSADTLIHKADRDLWSIKRTSAGEMFVERLFDEQGEPIKE